MGEENFEASQTSKACQEAIKQSEQAAQEVLRVKTPGGVYDVQWSTQGKATAMGQLTFFAEFLQALICNWLSTLGTLRRSCKDRSVGMPWHAISLTKSSPLHPKHRPQRLPQQGN
jgi:hypothetical protein